MPTSPISKPSPAKKNLPIKWRDSSWSPRLVIRSQSRRRPDHGFWPPNARFSDWDFLPEEPSSQGVPRFDRAGERVPGRRRGASSSNVLPFPYGHPRFFSPSGLGNLF